MGSVNLESNGPAHDQSSQLNQQPTAPWEHIAASKQAAREQSIRTWAKTTLSTAVPRLPPPSETNVVRFPVASGQLTARQVEITESIPSRILENIASSHWTAEEVLLSFIARATIAHYLTNPLAELFFERGVARARELDRHLRETGQTIGPLHGLPISLKDVFHVEGTPATAGYVALANTLCPTARRVPLHSPQFSHPYYLVRPVAGPLCRSVDGLEVYARNVLALRPWEWDFQCERLPWDEDAYQVVRQRAASGDLCIGFMATDGVVTPHPPIQRGMREVKAALRDTGVRVVDVRLLDGRERIWKTMMSIFGATGGEEARAVLNKSQEPVAKETVLPTPEDRLSVAELYAQGQALFAVRQQFLERWQRTRDITGTGRPIDFLVMPSGGHVAAPHGTMDYFLYEAVSNALDVTCATIPVTHVDPGLDPKHEEFTPLSEVDRHNWENFESCHPHFVMHMSICSSYVNKVVLQTRQKLTQMDLFVCK